MGRAYEVRKASIQKTGADKAKLYSMYAREIYAAAKNGGTSMEANAVLKRLVDKARGEQVPSDIIKRAIDKVNSGVDENYLTGCNNEIATSEFSVKNKLTVGDNIIYFTPDKEGSYTITCWLNMLKNTILVTSDETYFKGGS